MIRNRRLLRWALLLLTLALSGCRFHVSIDPCSADVGSCADRNPSLALPLDSPPPRPRRTAIELPDDYSADMFRNVEIDPNELDEYGQPVGHYKRNAIVQAQINETARLAAKSEAEAKTWNEWRAYDKAKAAAIERFEAEWAQSEKAKKGNAP